MQLIETLTESAVKLIGASALLLHAYAAYRKVRQSDPVKIQIPQTAKRRISFAVWLAIAEVIMSFACLVWVGLHLWSPPETPLTVRTVAGLCVMSAFGVIGSVRHFPRPN